MNKPKKPDIHNKEPCKPFQTYFGGKECSGTYQAIINQIPAIDTYCEPFVGNGAIFRHLKPPANIIINDLDDSVIRRYRQMKERERLPAQTIITNLNYTDCITQHIPNYLCGTTKALCYFDPPYMLSTRSSNCRYRFDWNDKDHFAFFEFVKSLSVFVAISHYPCPAYDNAFKEWRTIDYLSRTRTETRTERLYMNYETPEVLQDFRYMGKDFIERQRIKRKRDRFIRKYRKMSIQERNALLQCLQLP